MMDVAEVIDDAVSWMQASRRKKTDPVRDAGLDQSLKVARDGVHLLSLDRNLA